MLRKGQQCICDRCGKKMFVEEGSGERRLWKKFSYRFGLEPGYTEAITSEKDLCYKCEDKLKDLLDDFFVAENTKEST